MTSMRPLDTTEEAWRVQIEIWRRMSGSEKVALAWRCSHFVRALLESGIRARHADYSASEVRLAAIRRELGDDLFTQAYPGKPLLRP